MTKEQIEAIVATLPECVREFTKLDEQNKIVLKLVKTDNGEWLDVTIEAQEAEQIKILQKKLKALQNNMTKLSTAKAQ